MKAFVSFVILFFLTGTLCAQHKYTGKVFSAGEAASGIVISSVSTGRTLAVSNTSGVFRFDHPQREVVVRFTGVGYSAAQQRLESGADTVYVVLEPSNELLNEVVISTGYEKIPRERSTGSFTLVSGEVLNRSVSTGIIERLEGVTSSLQFDRRTLDMRKPGDAPELRIRGISTISSDRTPLIVVDNFPFEGDINQLNPNDVQEVILLKDAAAASIWGARAANGVIVITTKKGKLRQPLKLNIHTNLTIRQKPDLLYDPRFLNSEAFIEVEKTLFARNYYNTRLGNANMTPVSPVVELLQQNKTGELSDGQLQNHLQEMSTYNFREQVSRYLYREAVNQQYSISAAGGADKVSYRFSAGYDNHRTEMTGNTFSRVTLSSETTVRPSPVYELTMGLNYTGSFSENNGIPVQSLLMYPYARLADENGAALALPQKHRLSYSSQAVENGLLDWNYRPLEEIRNGDNTTLTGAFRLFAGVRLHLLQDLALDFKYQYQDEKQDNRDIQRKDTYYVRDLVNRFTQNDGARIFPYSDMLREAVSEQNAHNARIQVSYSPASTGLAMLAGAEIRQNHKRGNTYSLYNYEHDVLTHSNLLNYNVVYNTRPQGSSRIPQPAVSLSDYTNRYISYFGNASYSLHKKYIFSGSLRWDASNLFGVKTNQKGTPLWSAGFRWKLSDEHFYRFSRLPELSLRVSYGFNGNVNTSAAAFPVLRYATSLITGNRLAYVRNPGEPGLRWEKTGVINTGIDFKTRNSRLSGSLEYYSKDARDLLGNPILDPTAGYKPDDTWMQVLYNYASLNTRGVDITLQSRNAEGRLSWVTDYLFNKVSNRVTHYETIGSTTPLSYTNNFDTPPIVGQSLDAIYSFPWAGLDPDTGDPLVNERGQLTKNYSSYIGALALTDLVYSGVTVPKYQAGIRNSLTYKGISLSFNISLKAGYAFRRPAISYTDLFDSWEGHSEFLNRWQKPGDERNTQVPSMPAGNISNRDNIYVKSVLTIDKGDHVRWQDVNLAYQLPRSLSWRFENIRAFMYASNLGILWRANKHRLDPDYPTAAFLPGKNYSFGLQLTF